MASGTLWALVVVIFVNTLFLAGIAVALWVLNAKLNEGLAKTEPLLAKANEALAKAEALTMKLGARADEILDRTGHVVESVSRKVETATSIAEETISQPLIGAASLMAGLGRGWTAYRERPEKGDSDGNA